MALLLGVAGGTLAGAALAGKDLRGFKPPHEMTPEELEASKRASRTNVNDYAGQVTEEVSPIPWKAIGLVGAALLLATPLALRYYRETAESAGNSKRKSRARIQEPGEPEEAREPPARRLSAEGTRVPSGRHAQMPDPDGTRVPRRPPRPN